MHPDHKADFDNLADRLDGVLRKRPILFFINPGNWGDSLIREGAETFLRAYGFAYRSVRFKDILKKRTSLDAERRALGAQDAVMVYNGCGAFSAHYETAGRVADLARHFETAVFLPATFAVDIGRAAFPADTHFFARDRFESASFMPDAPFCHDMAFYLSVKAAEPVRDVAWFMRTDVERPNDIVVPEGNVDISGLGRAHSPIDGFLEKIGACRTLHTNRLHVGIGGALLGRNVMLSANDYFKIRAIYDSSLAGSFPNVQFSAKPKTID